MCGIAGVLARSGGPPTRETIDAMTAALAHRGPDGFGCVIDGPIGLGHRRLAIIDLSANAAQPMSTPDGRYTIVYNGEIYNFGELRTALERLGHRFKSHSDTEVLLHGFSEWGTGVLSRLNGMFAFAIWDALEHRLFLARDRYGIKPLYYTHTPGAFLFASEIKALLVHPDVSAALDHRALLEYFTFQNFLTDRTLFRDMRIVPAGSWSEIDAASGEPRTTRYWDFNFREPARAAGAEEYEEELVRLFRQAVKRQLVSDVGVNAYLSGGMDSGSITAVAAREVAGMHSFTVGVDLRSASGLELGMDERAEAEHMSYLFGTEHYEMVLKAGDMERAMRSLVHHIEEPRVGQSYPNYYAAKLASRFGKVVLSGAGGDELFAGYPWRYYRAVVNSNFEQYIDKYYLYWQRLIPNTEIKRVFHPIWRDVEDVWTRDIMRDVFAKHASELTRPEDYINHSLYFEAKTFLHGLLVVEDKLSMAHGLETRLPFLDNDLVDFAQAVPASLKLSNLGAVVRLNENEPGPKTERYFDATQDGKLLLRRAMRRHLPPSVIERQKRGFSAPDASWFRGESIDYVKRRLFNGQSPLYEFLDRGAIQDLVQQHLDGAQNRRLLIWSLLVFDEWCRVFLGADAAGAAA